MKREHEDPVVMIYGVHPVTELVLARPAEVERVFAARERTSGLGRVLRTARQAGVPVTYLPRAVLARRVGARAAHQGIAAQVAPIAYADLELLGTPDQDLLVLLDRVTDPGNLGAVLRTCAAAGVSGVVLSAEDSAGLTPVAAKSSAGAVERVPVARAAQPGRWLREARDRGFRAVALDPRAPLAWDRADLTGRLVLVAGGEHRGPRPGVLRACDERMAVPLASGVDSLNVSVSVGVALFEAVRQRRLAGGLETSRNGC